MSNKKSDFLIEEAEPYGAPFITYRASGGQGQYFRNKPVIFHIAVANVEPRDSGEHQYTYGLTACGRVFDVVDWDVMYSPSEIVMASESDSDGDKLCPHCAKNFDPSNKPDVDKFLDALRANEKMEKIRSAKRELRYEYRETRLDELYDESKQALEDFVSRLFESGLVGDGELENIIPNNRGGFTILSRGKWEFEISVKANIQGGKDFSTVADEYAKSKVP